MLRIFFSRRYSLHMFSVKSIIHRSIFPFVVKTLFIIFEERFNTFAWVRLGNHAYVWQIRKSQWHRFRLRNIRCESIFSIFGVGLIVMKLPDVQWPRTMMVPSVMIVKINCDINYLHKYPSKYTSFHKFQAFSVNIRLSVCYN